MFYVGCAVCIIEGVRLPISWVHLLFKFCPSPPFVIAKEAHMERLSQTFL